MSGDPSAADSALQQLLEKLIIEATVIFGVRNGESLRACNSDDTAFRLNVKYHVRLRSLSQAARCDVSALELLAGIWSWVFEVR